MELVEEKYGKEPREEKNIALYQKLSHEVKKIQEAEAR